MLEISVKRAGDERRRNSMLSKDMASLSASKAEPSETSSTSTSKKEGLSRRRFIGRVGMVAVAAGALGGAGSAITEAADAATQSTNMSRGIANSRVRQSFSLRLAKATAESQYRSRRTPRMATSNATPTNPRATARASCRTVLVWSICRLGSPSRRRSTAAKTATSKPSSSGAHGR